MSIADAPSLARWQRTQIDAEKDLAYCDAKWEQIHWVREELHLALRLAASVRRQSPVHVIGTHVSKSTLLPVYRMTRDGLEVILRGNYHDWSVTVRSEEPVIRDPLMPLLSGGVDTPVSSTLCEGFDWSWVHGPITENPRAFTVQLPYMHGHLWAFIYGLTAHLTEPEA